MCAFESLWKKLIEVYSLFASQAGAQNTSFSRLPDWVLHGTRDTLHTNVSMASR